MSLDGLQLCLAQTSGRDARALAGVARSDPPIPMAGMPSRSSALDTPKPSSAGGRSDRGIPCGKANGASCRRSAPAVTGAAVGDIGSPRNEKCAPMWKSATVPPEASARCRMNRAPLCLWHAPG